MSTASGSRARTLTFPREHLSRRHSRGAEGLAFIHRQWTRAEERVGVSQAIVEVANDRAVGLMWVALRPQLHVGGFGLLGSPDRAWAGCGDGRCPPGCPLGNERVGPSPLFRGMGKARDPGLRARPPRRRVWSRRDVCGTFSPSRTARRTPSCSQSFGRRADHPRARRRRGQPPIERCCTPPRTTHRSMTGSSRTGSSWAGRRKTWSAVRSAEVEVAGQPSHEEPRPIHVRPDGVLRQASRAGSLLERVQLAVQLL